jgi:hypothetical protein
MKYCVCSGDLSGIEKKIDKLEHRLMNEEIDGSTYKK